MAHKASTLWLHAALAMALARTSSHVLHPPACLSFSTIRLQFCQHTAYQLVKQPLVSHIGFSNFCFCLSLMVLKTRCVLVLICSSILLASFVERADVMLCASPLAFCVSLIRSLRNLTDASSATLRAPLVGTGGRTCTSLGTKRFLMHLVRKVG